MTITRVLDGDTYAFEWRGEEWSVRALGFDAFETRCGDRLNEQAAAAGITPDSALVLGLHQKARADSLLTGRVATVRRTDTTDNLDAYGRLLRVVVTDSGRVMGQ